LVPNYLSYSKRESDKFSKIAEAKVDVYFNNKKKRWELWYKGNLIIGMLDRGLLSSTPIVRRHFRDLRNRVGHKRLAEHLKRNIEKEEDDSFNEKNMCYWDETMPELGRADRNRTTFS